MKLEDLACPNCHAPLKGSFQPGQQVECDNCGSVFLASEVEAPQAIACPACSTINAITERYCTQCGESLKIDCVMCYTENPVGTVFCANCGAHLANARARRQKMMEERREFQRQRTEQFKAKAARQQAEKLQQLLDALDEPENHDFAIYQIDQLGEQAIAALIETMLHDDDVDARYGSARALGQICYQHEIKRFNKARVTKALVRALTDDQPPVRYWAANALGKCAGQSALEPLATLLKDKHQGVRQQVHRAIERIGGQRAAEILAQEEKRGLFNWIKGN